MDNRVLHSLEYDKILAIVAEFAQSQKARSIITELKPETDIEQCRLLLAQTAEADRLMYYYNVSPILSVDDVSESVMLAEKMSILSIPELIKIATVLRVSASAKRAVSKSKEEFPLLFGFGSQIYTADILAEEIDRDILNEEELSDYASPELSSIRASIRRGNEKLKEKLYSLVNGKDLSQYLQDNIVTKRGDRFVIPVKNEYRSYVKGIIHDQSSSGQTVFIEPAEIVEMNNSLRQLQIDEMREVERILRQLTAKVGSISQQIIANLSIILELDIIFSRAVFGRRFDCTEPKINDKGYINIKSGRHPLIDKTAVVPISVVLGDKYNILLVTGPNTGGKTVSLKLTGLFSLMAMSGLCIPAHEESEVSVFKSVYCDVGDEQSIEQSLSTFSSHIKNVVEIVDRADSQSLVLLDELGAGTDPEQGAALAVAITDYLLKKQCKCVITTHYSQLKEYSYVTDKVENASMDFNPQTFEPTYKLIIGVPGTSNALEISRRLGLKTEIVEAAQKGITSERQSFEEVLQSADQSRRLAEQKKEEAEGLSASLNQEINKYRLLQSKLQNEIDKLNVNAKKEVKRLVENALEEVNEIVDELKALLEQPKQSSYFEATRLRKRLEEINVEKENEDKDIPELSEEPPVAGDLVYVSTINKVARLETITKGGEMIVKIGNIKSVVRKNSVKKLADQNWGKEAPKKDEKKAVKYTNPIAPAKNIMELNLIGKHVDEAIYLLDEYIVDCKSRSIESVRIIHGNGTGALRLAVWNYLDSADVISFRLGKREEGGTGATVVRLR